MLAFLPKLGAYHPLAIHFAIRRDPQIRVLSSTAAPDNGLRAPLTGPQIFAGLDLSTERQLDSKKAVSGTVVRRALKLTSFRLPIKLHVIVYEQN